MLLLPVLKGYSVPGDPLSTQPPLVKIISSLRTSLSTSYIIQKNVNHKDFSNYLFLSNADYFFKKSGHKFSFSFHFKSELGYLKFIDSLWLKYSDNWKMNILLNEISSNTITHTYSLNINSQFLNSYKLVSIPNEEYINEWRGGFINPATFSFSYNIAITLWEYSTVLLGLTSVRVMTKPRYNGSKEPKETPLVITRHAYILAHFGMSGEVNIYSKKIAENITFDNTSSFFLNGFSKDQQNFDFQNRITFKLLKYLQLSLDTHIIYDPFASYNLQYTHQFLIGVFYDKRK